MFNLFDTMNHYVVLVRRMSRRFTKIRVGTLDRFCTYGT